MTDEATKVRTAILYLTNRATLWWRRRFANIEKGFCTIETWEDFKREIKKQFYLENVAYLARKNMRRLKHTSSMQLLGALQVNPKPSTPKTSLLSGVQVKKAKWERAKVACTHMDKVTKGKVNSMGKRKQHSKH